MSKYMRINYASWLWKIENEYNPNSIIVQMIMGELCSLINGDIDKNEFKKKVDDRLEYVNYKKCTSCGSSRTAIMVKPVIGWPDKRENRVTVYFMTGCRKCYEYNDFNEECVLPDDTFYNRNAK